MLSALSADYHRIVLSFCTCKPSSNLLPTSCFSSFSPTSCFSCLLLSSSLLLHSFLASSCSSSLVRCINVTTRNWGPRASLLGSPFAGEVFLLLLHVEPRQRLTEEPSPPIHTNVCIGPRSPISRFPRQGPRATRSRRVRRSRQLPARVNVQRDLERNHPFWDLGDLISAIFSNVSEVINVWLFFCQQCVKCIKACRNIPRFSFPTPRQGCHCFL